MVDRHTKTKKNTKTVRKDSSKSSSPPMWNSLTHEQQIDVLRRQSDAQLQEEYSFPGSSPEEIPSLLRTARELWTPKNLGEFREAGKPPSKDVVIGAYRDLDRVEALLELTDNSIDAWRRRREKYPTKTPDDLNIYIGIDSNLGILTYEDNAGGVSEENLQNLIIPGLSETTDTSHTIGSYKTGGKKAIFRLARAASIITRYWNPAGSSDDAFSVQLSNEWLRDLDKYKFPYANLTDKRVIDKGQTRFIFDLHDDPKGAPWYENPIAIKKIREGIQTSYSLIFVRNPEIHIFFIDRSAPLQPREDLFTLSQTYDSAKEIDIRPTLLTFKLSLEHNGDHLPVEVEVLLGCRTSSGRGPNTGVWGIDLYGNDRLFVSQDSTLFPELFPNGGGRNLVRGFVNIRGANVFIPWDTHKRHLNRDRDIIEIITKHKAFRENFINWKNAYNAISASPDVKETINTPPGPKKVFDLKKRDIRIPRRATIDIPVSLDGKLKARGFEPPPNTPSPLIGRTSARKPETIKLKIELSEQEHRALLSYFSLTNEPRRELERLAKDELIGRAVGKTRKRRGA